MGNADDYVESVTAVFAGNFNDAVPRHHRRADYRVPYTQSLEFFTDLRKRNVPARLVVFPEAGHWPSWYEMAFYYTVHLDWFQRWLGGGGPPWSPEAFMRGEVFAGGV